MASELDSTRAAAGPEAWIAAEAAITAPPGTPAIKPAHTPPIEAKTIPEYPTTRKVL